MKKKFMKATLTASLAVMMAVPYVAHGATDCQVQLRGPWEELKFANCTNGRFEMVVETQLKDWLKEQYGNMQIQLPGQLPGLKPELRPEQKPEIKPEQKPELKPELKPEQKPEIDQNQKPETKPESGYEENIGSYEMQVLQLVNAERAKAGLGALTYNAKLAQVAEAKAEDMMKNNYFSHTSPTYGSPFDMMKQFGINYTTAGENIAKGQQTPESVMNGWMNSSGHRANILSTQFDQIGVGYVKNGNSTYWVQMFIR